MANTLASLPTAESLSEGLRGTFIENAFSVLAVDAAIVEDARLGIDGCLFLDGESAMLVQKEGACERGQ